jgi:hypothetical protein
MTKDLFHSMNETAMLRATNVSRSACDARSAVGPRTSRDGGSDRLPVNRFLFLRDQHTNIRWIDLGGL